MLYCCAKSSRSDIIVARLPTSLQENRQPKAVDYLQNTKDQKKKQMKKKRMSPHFILQHGSKDTR